MERLEPIPSPPGHLIREFLHRAVPILVFAAAAAGVGLLWNNRFVGTMITGEVEALRADVTSLHSGTIVSFPVERFQSVTNGQVIAVLETMDADSASSDLEVVRSDLEVMRSRMALDEQRNDQNIEDIRMRWLESRVSLATLKVTSENSRRELERANRLFPDKIISEAELDSVRALHDALQAEVRERTVLVEGLQKTLDRLEAAGRRDRGDSSEVLNRSLAAQEKKLAHGRSIYLRAPMDGVVRAVYHRLGEQVNSGTPVVAIASHRSETIVGFVRQPLSLSPRPGMTVEIRTRGPKRQIASSNIRSVGSDLEQVASPLRLRGFDNGVERGLAFYVDLPSSLEVHPGEVVDLIVRPNVGTTQ